MGSTSKNTWIAIVGLSLAAIGFQALLWQVDSPYAHTTKIFIEAAICIATSKLK